MFYVEEAYVGRGFIWNQTWKISIWNNELLQQVYLFVEVNLFFSFWSLHACIDDRWSYRLSQFSSKKLTSNKELFANDSVKSDSVSHIK